MKKDRMTEPGVDEYLIFFKSEGKIFFGFFLGFEHHLTAAIIQRLALNKLAD